MLYSTSSFTIRYFLTSQYRKVVFSAPCQILKNPQDGDVTLSSDGSTTKATYSCSIGYSLKGTSKMSCQDDGLWDALPPICGMQNKGYCRGIFLYLLINSHHLDNYIIPQVYTILMFVLIRKYFIKDHALIECCFARTAQRYYSQVLAFTNKTWS